MNVVLKVTSQLASSLGVAVGKKAGRCRKWGVESAL